MNVRVAVPVGIAVAVGNGDGAGDAVNVGGGGTSRFATVCPKSADAAENANNTKDAASHRHPKRMRICRVR